MKFNINNVVIGGRVSTDIDYKAAAEEGRSSIGNFSVAVDRISKDKEGKAICDFIRVVVFDRQAELAHQCLDKGAPVIVTGRIQTRRWESSERGPQTTVEVVAKELIFPESRAEREARNGSRPSGSGPAPQAQHRPAAVAPTASQPSQPEGNPFDEYDDDDPFGDS